MNMHVRIQTPVTEIDYSGDDWMKTFINQKIDNERKRAEDRVKNKMKHDRRERRLDDEYSR